MPRLHAPAALVLALAVTWPTMGEAQAPRIPPEMVSLARPEDSRWEVSLGGRVGMPTGYLKVSENGARGTRLRLQEDLGIDVSEALETSLAFHLTPRDAVRGTYLHYFLEGSAPINKTVAFNGDGFGPGRVHTNADFYRVSLDYERLLMADYGTYLTGTVGLTYVHLDPELSGQGQSSREDFYRQELPVPILGLRFDVPMGPRFLARGTLGGGGLPRVDSGRKEGGTVHLEQIHADAGLTVIYAFSRAVQAAVGYGLTYFFQHEESRQEDNTFELIDQGLRLGLTFRF